MTVFLELFRALSSPLIRSARIRGSTLQNRGILHPGIYYLPEGFLIPGIGEITDRSFVLPAFFSLLWLTVAYVQIAHSGRFSLKFDSYFSFFSVLVSPVTFWQAVHLSRPYNETYWADEDHLFQDFFPCIFELKQSFIWLASLASWACWRNDKLLYTDYWRGRTYSNNCAYSVTAQLRSDFTRAASSRTCK